MLVGNTNKSEVSDDQLCQYCGNNVLFQTLLTEGGKVYHQECCSVHMPWCKEAVKAFRVVAKNEHVLWMAIDVKYLYGSKTEDKSTKKREKRGAKVTELIKLVSALRNSNSGFLLIHLVGLDPSDNFSGAFDELVDIKLLGLINDGGLFDEVYRKRRLSDHKRPELKKFKDILVLYVEGSEILVTADCKTKLALDDSVVDTPDATVLKFIKARRQFKEKFHEIKVDGDLSHLQESRNLQSKVYFHPKTRDDDLVHNVFNTLRVAELISAFSKNKDGGSYLLGLEEQKHHYDRYWSKVLRVKPVFIDNYEAVVKLIIDSNDSTCLVCDYDGNKQPSDDIVKIFFLSSEEDRSAGNNKCVVHISVRSVSGIVFCDKDGPVAYRVVSQKPLQHPDTHPVTSLTVSEWFKAFRERQ